MEGGELYDRIIEMKKFGETDAARIIYQILLGVAYMHSKNIVHRDLKPENVLITQNEVKILDLGLAKILNNQKQTDIFLIDQRYAAPEWCTEFRASEKSLVYQLGIIFVQLLTGKHPFILVDLDKNDPISAVLRSAWPSMLVEPNLYGVENELINKMLDKDPNKRPMLKEVADELIIKEKISIVQKVGKQNRSKKNNTVLFVARMGIPHKGHIEYISRFLEMGFSVKIALSRAYTITQKDPLSKWIVMKMIAQSLIQRGFSAENFEFMLTPFYETDDEMKMHFLMMPKREEVIGVASSNPDVWRLFPDKPLFDQQSVFGVENEMYVDKSWGEIVRKAVREDDYATFNEYAAKGVEKILSFSEIQKYYGKPEIEFVEGSVKVVLLDINNKEIEFYTEIPNEDIRVVGDPNWIGRSVSNLIINGIQAVEKGVKPIIHLSLKQTSQKRVLITVEDNGKGQQGTGCSPWERSCVLA